MGYGQTRLCHEGISEKSLLYTEDLFYRGSQATAMYFVAKGRLSYKFCSDAFDEVLVTSGERIAEIALWVKWDHRGKLSGIEMCTHLLQVNVTTFQNIVSASRE